ncbi:uncharacterized protein [Coffea arabica]|uniref:Integrase catalytic domain-containing protein n=1 Tax=Coffea arabica TaxID=13443 RepID=A0ABM4X717_COFAR
MSPHILDNVYKLHGLLESIISDRDKIFISRFWQELFNKLGISLHYSSSYHHQSDGQSERVNQCLENYLRSMCSEHPTHWSSWLPTAELWIDSKLYLSSKRTWPSDEEVERAIQVEQVKVPLGPMTRARVKRLNETLQTLVRAARESSGESKAIEVGAVAYKLLLPERARIHPVFHVSLLKKKIGNTQAIEATLPALDTADQCKLKPEKVLKRRATMRNL